MLSELPPIGTVAQGDRDIGGDAACMRMGMAELRFPTQLLTDEVVLLRPWRETDVPAKLMAFSEPLVQRFLWPRSTPYTEADARRYFVEQEHARLRGEELNFAFVEPEGDDVVLGGAHCTTSSWSSAGQPSATGLRPRLVGAALRPAPSASSPGGHSKTLKSLVWN